MSKLRQKAWEDREENPSSMETKVDTEKSLNDHSLININRDLMKVETSIRRIRKKRANQTSVSLRLHRSSSSSSSSGFV